MSAVKNETPPATPPAPISFGARVQARADADRAARLEAAKIEAARLLALAAAMEIEAASYAAPVTIEELDLAMEIFARAGICGDHTCDACVSASAIVDRRTRARTGQTATDTDSAPAGMEKYNVTIGQRIASVDLAGRGITWATIVRANYDQETAAWIERDDASLAIKFDVRGADGATYYRSFSAAMKDGCGVTTTRSAPGFWNVN